MPERPESDRDLVERAAGGSREAFAALYDRRAPLIRAVCWDVTRNPHTTAELTQEVFLRAFQNLGRLRQRERYGPWLLGIARRVCHEWGRARPMGGDGLETKNGVRAPDPAPDAGSSEALRHAVAGLPEPERLAVHAFYLLDMDAVRAAEALGISRSGLYALLASARARLRRVLEDQEIMP